MKTNEKLNLTMLCDFYELTMGNGYFVDGKADQICYFDVFFRNVPDGGGFAIAAGLEQVVEYIRDLHFSEDDLAYLRGRGIFDEGFLHYLENFHFTGDIYAVPEGTPVFPREPILTVRAPAIEAQLVETYILLALNHQSLIATKANRVVRAAEGRRVLEFGSRRAQGAQAAILGARAAYIGGCDGTRPSRRYYTDFAKLTPPDTVILTLACGKFRLNDLPLGTVAGLPRILDVGQCNDAYSAIRIALGLAEAFDCSVNELPLSIILCWFEQKAVCVLMALLALGIRGIRLGPTLPAFLSPGVAAVLQEKYDLRPITTPEDDLAACLGRH